MFVGAFACALVIGAAAAPSASAHKSDWCRHSNDTQGKWWVYYDRGGTVTYNGNSTHYHWTLHYWGPSAGAFHKYKHEQRRICGASSAPARAAAPAAAAAEVCTNLSPDPHEPQRVCVDPGGRTSLCPVMEVNRHEGCGSLPVEDELPEATPVVDDPMVTTARSSVLLPQVRASGAAARFVELRPQFDGGVAARAVAGEAAAECVLSVTDRAGSGVALGELSRKRSVVVETAGAGLARRLGHPC